MPKLGIPNTPDDGAPEMRVVKNLFVVVIVKAVVLILFLSQKMKEKLIKPQSNLE